jgi:Acetyltransferase (GNAT) domain
MRQSFHSLTSFRHYEDAMWNVRSLGYRTDLFICAFDGIVTDRGRYIVVRTPSNPGFWWGNFLLYPDAPDARAAGNGHDGAWLDDHAREIPGSKAILLAWDCPDGTTGEVEPFLREGFALDEGCILTATSANLKRPPKYAADVEVIEIHDEAQWGDAVDALTNAFAPKRSGSLADLRDFVVKQCTRYRAMQERGLGQWYGAVVDGEMAAALGIVRDRELGRFQLVGTDPKFGRRGVCSTLVHDAAQLALAKPGLETFVMAADATYHAAKVYESVGFHATERLIALLKKPPRI